jgi:hypothetical protein
LRIKAEQQKKDKSTPIREGELVGEIVQITLEGSANFIITPDMMLIDEEMTQNLVKDIETLYLAMLKIPTTELYKL